MSDRFTNTFEALLAALADAVKQLGEGSQQPQGRQRVEEAKQDFISCCDIMCFQLKQAMEVVKAEMQQAAPASAAPQEGASMEADQVRQLLESVEAFAARLRAGGVGGGSEAGGAGGGNGDFTAGIGGGVAAGGGSGGGAMEVCEAPGHYPGAVAGAPEAFGVAHAHQLPQQQQLLQQQQRQQQQHYQQQPPQQPPEMVHGGPGYQQDLQHQHQQQQHHHYQQHMQQQHAEMVPAGGTMQQAHGVSPNSYTATGITPGYGNPTPQYQ